jgi:hypothetical protein
MKMDYLILDSAGNAVASFEDEVAARATIHAIVAVEPEAAQHLALLAYDEDGQPVGEAVSAMDVPPPFEITTPFFEALTTQFFEALVQPVEAMKLPEWTQMLSDWDQTLSFGCSIWETRISKPALASI